jgi:type I restriction enzyme S subunit
MNEERWEVPVCWSWSSIGDIAEVVGGGTPSTTDESNFSEHGIPWLTPADLSDYEGTYIERGRRDLSDRGYNESAARLMPAGTVLYSSRAPIGYCTIASNEISTNQGFKSFVPKGNISPEYIRHYLLASTEYAESKASGTTFKELSGSRAAELAVPVAPLPEQRRIVTKIDSLTAKSRRARDHLDHIPRLVEKYKQAILAAAFRGELAQELRNSRQAEWKVVSVGDVFEWSSGKGLSSKQHRGGKIPVLGGNGITGHHDTALIDFPTIVVGRVGAQCGNVHRSDGPAWITDNAIYAKSIASTVDLDFAVLFFRNADLNSLAGGTGQPYVNQPILNSLNIPLPLIEEQLEIVHRINKALRWIDRLASEATSARRLINHLDQAILAKAFRGKLVPQDPNDEPASVLLERIRAERAAAGPLAKKGTAARKARSSVKARP